MNGDHMADEMDLTLLDGRVVRIDVIETLRQIAVAQLSGNVNGIGASFPKDGKLVPFMLMASPDANRAQREGERYDEGLTFGRHDGARAERARLVALLEKAGRVEHQRARQQRRKARAAPGVHAAVAAVHDAIAWAIEEIASAAAEPAK